MTYFIYCLKMMEVEMEFRLMLISCRHNFKEARGEGAPPSRVNAAAYHKKIHILVTGFKDGAFFLHEMPDFNLIHSLR